VGTESARVATTDETNGAPEQGHLKQELRTATGRPTPWWWLVLAGAAALFLGLGAVRIIGIFARPLAYLILAVTIAATLAPLATWLAKVMPRVVAAVLIYLVLAGILASLAYFVLPSFITEARQFSDRIPELMRNIQQWLSGIIPTEEEIMPTSEDSFFNMASSWLDELGTQVLSLPLRVTSAVLDALLVIFLSLYALILVPKAHSFLLSLAPERTHPRVERIAGDIFESMGGYFRGVLISGTIIAVLTYVGLLVIGVEFPLVLSITAGMLEFVPVIGPIIAGALIVIVALLQSGGKALTALIYVLILQQVESNILFPNIIGSETRVSPFLSLFAFFAGAAVGGLLGAVVAVPLAAALRIFVLRIVAPGIRQLTDARDKQQATEEASS
jgi:predicted PurR-regulated permease PerM